MRSLVAGFLTLVVLQWVCAANAGLAAQMSIFSDDFEDGVINNGLWDVGGRRISWTPNQEGQWIWSNNETLGNEIDPNGHLCLRVTKPIADDGFSYGAISWVRTKYNFNDGQSHVLDFTWQGRMNEDHSNIFFMQITDGYLPTFAEKNWWAQFYDPAPDGTKDLLWEGDKSYATYYSDTIKQSWSIIFNPSGTARLYDAPNGGGSMLHEESLDSSKDWYVRFMVCDSHNYGAAGDDTQLNLYSFSTVPEPSTFFLLGIGTIGLLGYACWWRKRAA